MKISWITPIEITQDGYYPLQATEASAQVYMISKNFGVNEYLLIENRQPILWDADIPGGVGGVVIYHVDEMKIDQSTRGYPGHPNWPVDHYMVSVVQADGLYQIEKGENAGDAGDFWRFGMSLGPGGSNNTPSTDSVSTGVLVRTGITIEVVTASQLIMMIRVSGLGVNTKIASTSSRAGEKDMQLFEDDIRVGTTDDPKTVHHVAGWLLSMLGGSAIMIGFLLLVL
jgi:hypothetical protein